MTLLNRDHTDRSRSDPAPRSESSREHSPRARPTSKSLAESSSEYSETESQNKIYSDSESESAFQVIDHSVTADEAFKQRLDKKRKKISEIDDHRARHIFRVANQKAARRSNPPPRKPKLYKCTTCSIYCNSPAQLHIHNHSRVHQKALTRRADSKTNTYCTICNRELGSKHDFDKHIKSAKHCAIAKRRRLA